MSEGYYAGFIAGAFMLGRFASSYPWGRFSDKYGRKPALLIGAASVCVFSLGFGLSTELWVAVLMRLLLGALNGTVSTCKVCVSEICGKAHEVKGMGYITGCWSISFVIGPALGGLLADPCNQYPGVFPRGGAFERFPYLLPNALASIFGVLSLVTVWFMVPETSGPRSTLLPSAAPAGSSGKNLKYKFQRVATTEGGVAGGGGGSNFTIEDADDDALSALPAKHPAVELPRYHGGSSGGSSAQHSLRSVASTADAALSDDSDDDGDDDHDGRRLDGMQRNGGSGSGGGGGGGGANGNGNGDRNGAGAMAPFGRHLSQHGSVRHALLDGSEGDLEKGEGRGQKGDGGDVGGGGAGHRSGVLALLSVAPARRVLVVYMVLSLLVIMFDETYPLWALSTQQVGGLDWQPGTIGQVLSMAGVFMALFQFLVYPHVARALGYVRMLKVVSVVVIPLYALFPMCSLLRDRPALLWPAMVCIKVGSNMIFTSIFLIVNNSVEGDQRGGLNGLAMTAGSAAKAIGPPLGATLFAYSIAGAHSLPLVDYHLTFVVCAVLSIAVAVASHLYFPDDLIKSPETQKAEAATAAAEAAEAVDEDAAVAGAADGDAAASPLLPLPPRLLLAAAAH
ncbi:major facilitator superfamily domain-containing protein [Tribonema minus]|uniref:Major facilitator superfamily domain-containing protein n=1 Tax=Tribonema minus TaxID=303371 RepID=A0A835Z5M2_9STRA|nr:major facilitator superfamily domain-containing protein [Tribonema minus]